EKARLCGQAETPGAPGLRGAPERREVEVRRQVLISRPLQKLLVDPAMVVRQERAAPALWSVQVMRLVAVVHHHEIPLLHETHRPGDPAWGGQTDVRFLPRLQGELRFGEKTLERRSRQRQKRFVELAFAQ